MLNKIPSHSLLLKLMAAVAAAQIFMFSLALSFQINFYERAIEDYDKSETKTIALLLNAALSQLVSERNYTAAQAVLNDLINSKLRFFEVYDNTGKLFASAGTQAAAPGILASQSPADKVIGISRDLQLGPETVGEVRFGLVPARPESPHYQLLYSNIAALSLGIALTAILTGLLGYQIIARIKALLRRTQAIAEGDYSIYSIAANPSGRDELSQLSEAFNRMTAALKNKTEALQRSEQRFRAIAEATPYGLSIVSQDDGIILYANKALDKMLATDKGISQRKSSDFWWNPGEGEQINNTVKEKGKLLGYELHLRRADGGSLWVLASTVKMIYENRPAFLAGFIDITKRKQAETALRESEEKFARAFQASPDILIISDFAEGRVVELNEAGLLKFGYRADEIIGQSLRKLPIWVSESDRQTYLGMLQNETRVRDFAAQLQHKSGEVRNFLLSAELFKWRGETHILAIIRDVSETHRLEQQNRRQQLKLIQTNRIASLGTLVSGVAHEINNPNSLILMNAQIMIDAWADITKAIERCYDDTADIMLAGLPYRQAHTRITALIGDIRSGALRIQKIVDDLKSFSRPGEHNRSSQLHLNDVIQRSLDLLKHVIAKKTNRLGIDLSHDLPPVTGDPLQLEQVIVNLLMNALEALPDKDHGITVSSRWDKKQRRVEIGVRDEGIGIEHRHFEHIFDPFFTTKLEQGGTGLGLAISYQLIRQHGGDLELESETGKGTLARIILPLDSAATARQAVAH